MSAIDLMEDIADKLRQADFVTHSPVREEASLNWDQLTEEQALSMKRRFMTDYFEIIQKSDAILVVNPPKNEIPGYIGANTLMEIACAAAHGKRIFLLDCPGAQPCRLEALSVAECVLEGDLKFLIEQFDK